MSDLPITFLLGGAPKAGTTSLYARLAAHPDVFMSRVKEPSFFSLQDPIWKARYLHKHGALRRRVADLHEYVALFDGRAGEKVVGEASTSYLSVPTATEKIRELAPQTQLAFIFRHPVDRAYSAYVFQTQIGQEDYQTFEESLAAELVEPSDSLRSFPQYRMTGRYGTHLQRILEIFPPEQIRCYLTEDLKRDADGLVADLYEWLGVDPTFVPPPDDYNLSGIPRSKSAQRILYRPNKALRVTAQTLLPPKFRRGIYQALYRRNLRPAPSMDPSTRAELTGYFAEDVKRLSVLLNRDLSAWLSPDKRDVPPGAIGMQPSVGSER